MPELFQTHHRYTAAGFSYNIPGVLGGAEPNLAERSEEILGEIVRNAG